MAGFGGVVKLTGETEYRRALSNITDNLKVLSSELKTVTSQYDKNDKSTQNLSSQNEVLNKKIAEQEEKVSVLTKALAKAKTETGENSTTTKKWQTELNNAQAELNSLNKKVKDNETAMEQSAEATEELDKSLKDVEKSSKEASGGFTVMKGALANLVADGFRLAIDGAKELISSMVDIGKQAVQNYADYEQLVGGVETLFKNSAGIVQEYADNAFKTAGLSANEYMETVTSFSASLLQSLGGDTVKATQYADMAITDMSDNANKMGTAMSSIQTAYQGFAKQNYSMLDNLKLGYGGTQKEMYRLMSDAAKLNSTFANEAVFSLDEKGHLEAGYNDIVKAIHIIQTEMGITGTTALEASTTISGSINSMKSAWQNLLTGMANENVDTNVLVSNFVDSLKTVADNLLPVIGTVIKQMIPTIKTAIEELKPIISNFLKEILPEDAFNSLTNAFNNIKDFINFMNENGSTVVSIISGIVAGFMAFKTFTFIATMVTAVKKLFTTIKSGTSIMTAFNVVMNMNPFILIATAVVGLVAGLITLWNTNEDFRNAVIGIWENIKNAFFIAIEGIKSFFTGLINFVKNNWKGLLLLIVNPFAGAFKLLYDNCEGFRNFVNTFVENIKNTLISWGENIASFFTETIPQAISNAITFVMETLTVWGQNIANFFTNTIPQLWQSLLNWFAELPYKIGYALGNAIGQIINWGIEAWNYLSTNVPMWIESIGNFFSELPGKIWTWLSDTWEKFVNWGTDMWNKAIEIGSNAINYIVKFFSELPGKIGDWLLKAVTKIVEWGTNTYNTAKTWVENTINSIVQYFSELPGKVGTWLSSTIDKVVTFGSNMAKKGKEGATNTFNNIVNGFKELPAKMAEIGKNVVEGIWNGIKNAGNWIKEKVGDFASGILDGMKDALGIHSPSKLFEDQVGKNIALGIGSGFDKEMRNVTAEMNSAIPTSFDVNSSVNGTSSVSGTSSNYNSMVEAFKEALTKVKVVMDDREMGTFVTDTMERVIYV